MAWSPHGHCWRWNPWLLSTIVPSDVVIGVSYLVIASALIWMTRHRSPWLWLAAWTLVQRTVPVLAIWLCSAAFIAFCGLGHHVDAVAVWRPIYAVVAVVRVLTALVSAGTAGFLLVLCWHVRHPPDAETLSQTLAQHAGVTALDLETAGRLDQVTTMLGEIRSLLDQPPPRPA